MAAELFSTETKYCRKRKGFGDDIIIKEGAEVSEISCSKWEDADIC